MYHSYKCVICGKIFYTFNSSKQYAAEALYNGMQKHIKDYGEDHSEYDFRESPEKEIYKLYYSATESEEPPVDGYPV